MKKWKFCETYDVIVVGGGHAGCEAAAAAARLGSKTLLISTNLDLLAFMSCNPAIGGVAKGQIVREIDALGGYTGIATDLSTIQFRMLNSSKGAAMWSPRAQCDMIQFSRVWRKYLENVENLDLRQDSVVALWVNGDRVLGVETQSGVQIEARAVVITAGTFLNGKIHIGERSFSGGRIGEGASFGLSDMLKDLGFEVSRLKTGTPVRIDGRTIDFSRLIRQDGDQNPSKFSFSSRTKAVENQTPCYLAYTSQEVHQILQKGFEYSPMFTGRIQGTGPRYCPSIEDKIVRFSQKDKHQLFVEPMGRDTNEYYLNGFSSSLPEEVQIEALRKIEGFEKARIFKCGYAIEYDYFPPTQLKNTLETKLLENLYFAGQINGTTGYEEAACQGLMAGINAHRKIYSQEAFVLDRSQGYIGVLIDDLVTKGVDEPYRMFTSRAEYRILLRQDNADKRLSPLGYEIGLLSEERMQALEKKIGLEERISKEIESIRLEPSEVNEVLLSCGTSPIAQRASVEALLSRPQIGITELMPLLTGRLAAGLAGGSGEGCGSGECGAGAETGKNLGSDIMEALQNVEISIKYRAYIEKEKESVERLKKYEKQKIPQNLDYSQIQSISFEGREKLSKIRPENIGQAMRISGVSPSDMSVLLIMLSKS